MRSQKRRIEKLESQNPTNPAENFNASLLKDKELARFEEVAEKVVNNDNDYSVLTDPELDDLLMLIEKGES